MDARPPPDDASPSGVAQSPSGVRRVVLDPNDARCPEVLEARTQRRDALEDVAVAQVVDFVPFPEMVGRPREYEDFAQVPRHRLDVRLRVVPLWQLSAVSLRLGRALRGVHRPRRIGAVAAAPRGVAGEVSQVVLQHEAVHRAVDARERCGPRQDARRPRPQPVAVHRTREVGEPLRVGAGVLVEGVARRGDAEGGRVVKAPRQPSVAAASSRAAASALAVHKRQRRALVVHFVHGICPSVAHLDLLTLRRQVARRRRHPRRPPARVGRVPDERERGCASRGGGGED
mmetsp:Transcript_14773/g.49551  ORF Transcript_14773/g.49551 Transcript_14773/m.49551 type:complete len:287 (+) Transcript_14773:80-940(+)|eukprot:CAMPEP_0206819866 /NCGR_PEP_ID=MMETSP0975-20121206/11527_1 /ASSEMBLY_ACC=CAM_ASM_000399 /TAXON_ID=483370 /ORGANISM="non described non described, Strain CCMP2097" /LENGTH=286 /DNA_ID=CAMNT_0054362099 /DNA_START=56 /DNA_END=916 /DNA_ORIENTATION=+